MKIRKWLLGALLLASALPAATASAATGASVSSITASSLQLNWSLQPGEGVVTVYQNGSYLATYAGNGMIVNGLSACTSYTFTVAGGSGYATTSASATTLGCAPAPTAPSISYTSTYSTVNLSWTASNAVSYEVYKDNVLLGTTSGTVYSFSGSPSRAYSVRVVAVNSTGQTASASITATTQAFSGTWINALSGNIRVGGAWSNTSSVYSTAMNMTLYRVTSTGDVYVGSNSAYIGPGQTIGGWYNLASNQPAGTYKVVLTSDYAITSGATLGTY
ncbi:fibronectin type III domain-containing protein [Cohnella hashimotonis]|uniref:Fibronectin type III domain-containing protein n=1 Tax=Cohnella hashimotonis TaxID=2826895 RepID=A0ABT6TG63_9BACL|nr:fibronectin type III domain-containing protein [Cohnella hashimotonis]MDI4645829.1 fibronectin type III domain-containing protein [Cohnella hashimotonis]